MSVDLAVMWGNSLMAFVAAVVNLRVAVTHPDRRRRFMRQTVGIVALIYSAGYAVLALGMVPILKWSEFFRMFSLIVWAIVWTWPAVVDARKERNEHQFAVKLREVAQQRRAA